MPDATIWGKPVEWWEERMEAHAHGVTGFRGLRVEPDHNGVLFAWSTQLPNDAWLGIHHDGLRMGSRVTLADIGWLPQANDDALDQAADLHPAIVKIDDR